MLKLYQQKSDNFTERVKRKLEEMVVAHKLITVDTKTSLPTEVWKSDLPVLSNGHQVWKSQDEIEQHLEELHQEMMLGRSMQSDSCHLDPDNPEECL